MPGSLLMGTPPRLKRRRRREEGGGVDLTTIPYTIYPTLYLTLKRPYIPFKMADVLLLPGFAYQAGVSS